METDKSHVGIDIRIPVFDRLGLIQYVFTTRQNGMGARINGLKQPGDWNTVADQFNIKPDRLVTIDQVHGDAVVRVDEQNFKGMGRVQADGMITKTAGIAVGIETADCVPILLADAETPAVAAVHAGWRSTVRKIARKAVRMMQKEFGSDPARIIAAIGPAIGPECYEVDEPVMAPLRESFPFWRDVAEPRGHGKWSLDLVKLNRIELMQAGLPQKSLYSFGLCTCCRNDLFYSFRAEGRTGRMLSVIMIKP
jgi:YfiH family protein